MKKHRVLSASPFVLATHEYLPFRGGAATYVREVAMAAWKEKFELEIWTVDTRWKSAAISAADSSIYHESLPGPPVVRFASNGRLTPNGLWSLARGWWRERHRLRERPVALMSVGAQMVFFWFHLFGVVPAWHTLVFFHGSEVLRFSRGLIWRWLARRYYARAGGFAACSQYTARIARESGLLPAGAQVAVASCALPAAFTELRLPDEGERDAGEDGTWRVLTVARLHPRKGQLDVARALALLPARLRGRVVYQMVGVGDEGYRAEIEAACRAGGVRCEFLGALEDRALAAVYARCTLYAQASRTLKRSVEGFGISFLEAAFYGKPAAAFLSGGVAEAVIDGQTGLLVPEGDLPGLASAIERLLDDPTLRATLGAAGRDFAGSLKWEDAARVLCEALARVAA